MADNLIQVLEGLGDTRGSGRPCLGCGVGGMGGLGAAPGVPATITLGGALALGAVAYLLFFRKRRGKRGGQTSFRFGRRSAGIAIPR